jgi:hypothetical protein
LNVKSILKYVLSAALAGVLLWLALRSVDWTAFLEGLKVTKWLWLVPFFAASVGALVFRAFRWRLLLRSTGLKTRWLEAWDANNVGNLANLGLPGAGEVLRCGYVSGKSGFASVFGTVLMERLWDIVAIFLMLTLSLVLDRDKFGPFFLEQVWEPMTSRFQFSLWWVLVVVVVLVALFFWAVYHFRAKSRLCAKIAGALSSVGQGFSSFGRMEHKGAFLLFTLGIWTMYLLMAFSVMKSMPDLAALDLKDALFFTVVGNCASIIPVPGGIGAYHYLMALAVSGIYGKTWEAGILYATLQHELHAVLVLVLGVISYLRISVARRHSNL